MSYTGATDTKKKKHVLTSPAMFNFYISKITKKYNISVHRSEGSSPYKETNVWGKTETRWRDKDNREVEDAAGDSDRMVRSSPGGCGLAPGTDSHKQTHKAKQSHCYT